MLFPKWTSQRCVSTILVIVVVLSSGASDQRSVIADPPAQTNIPNVGEANSLSRSFRRVAENALPILVTIHTPTSSAVDKKNPSQMQSKGASSGFIIDSSGVILTNHHVIEGAEAVIVRLADGREFQAADVRSDSRSDLAIIRIDGAGKLPQARLGNSDEIQIGDWTIAVGNPFGLGPSVTAGILSGKERKLDDKDTLLLQTDAATNPGSSGGPLLNLRGEVIGVSEGGYGFGGGFEGVGFAIPANIVSCVVKELRRNGSVRRSYLGISSERLSPDVAEKLGVETSQNGVIVTKVLPNTPAAQSGLKVTDVITHYASKPVRSPEQLQMLIEYTRDKNPTELQIIRGGNTTDHKVRLQPLPQQLATVDSVPGNKGHVDEILGLEVTTMSSNELRQHGYQDQTEAVLVRDVRPHSMAYYRRINPGMVIRRVGKHQIHNLSEFKSAMQTQSHERGVLFLIGTPTGDHFVVLKR